MSVNNEEGDINGGNANNVESSPLIVESDPEVLTALGGALEFVHAETTSGAGQKTISTGSGIFLLLNNMMGVGLPLLPIMYQQAGFLVPTIVVLFVAVFSAVAGNMLAEAMKYLPNNRDFEDRVEYSSLAKFYLGKWPYIMTQVVLNLALLSLNLVSILLTVQVMDWTLLAIFKCTYAVSIAPHPAALSVCQVANSTVVPDGNSPFPQGNIVLSVGYAVVIALVIPMGYFNLDDNIIVQVISTIIQLAIIVSWIVTCFLHGFDLTAVPVVGPGPAQGNVLGNIMINYAFITTIPSWVNEKRRSSSVKRVVWPAVGLATLCYLSVGILGALAFPNLGTTDLLTRIANDPHATIIDKISVYMFPLIAVASSIPIFSIIIRYNLVENKVLSLRWANFVSVLLPWLLVIPLTAGNTIFNLVSAYTSLLFQLPINLCVPFVIYVLAMRRRATLKPCYCEQGPCEHDIIDEMHVIAREEHLSAARIMGTKEERGGLRDSAAQIRAQLAQEEAEEEEKEKWSARHPEAARRCCACWVSCMDQRESDPLAPWSKRHWMLAKVVPEGVRDYLDDEQAAPEHFALPSSLSTRARENIGVALFVVSIMLFLLALALSIWDGVLQLQGNSTDASSSRDFLVVANRKINTVLYNSNLEEQQ